MSSFKASSSIRQFFSTSAWRAGCRIGGMFTLICAIGCGGSAQSSGPRTGGNVNGSSGATGTITSVTAGPGLTGGGSSGNVTLAVDNTVARTTMNQTYNGNMTVDGSNQNGIDFGEIAFAPNNGDIAKSDFEWVGPQLHFRLSRAYCDKRSISKQTAFDQDHFFCPPFIPDGVVIDDQHPPSTTPNKDFIIAPYQNGMSMSYPGGIEISSAWLSVRARNLTGRSSGAILDVGDNDDAGALRLSAFDVLDSTGAVDRSQSFVEMVSDTFAGQSHGDMLFAVRDPLDGFRFQLLGPQVEEAVPNGGYKVYTVARIDSTGKGFFDGGTQTGGADFAESISTIPPRAEYEPGDVLVIATDSDRKFSLSSTPYSTLVAGIYSTKPGVVATSHRSEDPKLAGEIPMAIVGIVPCKVTTENGPIARGDLLVTSSTPGYAMRGTDKDKLPGAILGKALQSLAQGKGKIEVLVTLR
jgi:hypothetical protein